MSSADAEPRRPVLSNLPILEPTDEDETDDVLTVLMTGASGNLGRKLRAAWGDQYDLILLDLNADPADPDVIVTDLADADDSWMDFFDDADVVVHLAANPNEFSPWDQLDRPNLNALFNVCNATMRAGVRRFVFASSNHVMGNYEHEGVGPIPVTLPPKPDSPYGSTKLMGERLGLSLAQTFGLSFVALRLGWIQSGENLPETLPHDWAKKMWLSNRDLVQLFTKAVEVELEEGQFVLVNGMSRNAGMRWTLDEAKALLGFIPEDGAA
jgi:NAD+ dependent glucose-6-phosphate dehydrogenase